MAQVWTHIGGEALERWSGRPAGKAASQVWSLHRGLEVHLQTSEGVEEDREAEAPKVRAQGATNLEAIIQKRDRVMCVSCVSWKPEILYCPRPLNFSDNFHHDFYPQNI